MALSRKAFLLSGSALSLTAVLAACGNGSSSATASSSASASGTVEVKHAFGTTTVPATVNRIATIAWGNQDVPLALDVMPVGIAKQTWGVEDGSGMLPWTKEKVEELQAGGAEAPTLFDETDSIDFEAISTTQPDVILAAYSGITQEDYETLSKIAPTIAFPNTAWGTPWRDMILNDAAGMGQGAAGQELVANLESFIAEELAAFPQIAGKRAAFFFGSVTDLSTFGFYVPADPRTGFLADLGLAVPPSVETAAAANEGSFFVSVSQEVVDTLSDVDLIVMYGEESDLAGLQADALIGTIPAIRNGAVAFVGNGTPLSAATNPTPLSLRWGLRHYLELIGAAADKVPAAQ